MSIEKPSRDLNLLAPWFEKKLLAALAECKAAGLPLELFEGFRSASRQADLYKIGRTLPGKKVTYNKSGTSWHALSVACDVVFYDGRKWSWDGNWDAVQAIFERHDFESLSFERCHFQIRGGLKIEEANKIVKEGSILDLWNLIESRLLHT